MPSGHVSAVHITVPYYIHYTTSTGETYTQSATQPTARAPASTVNQPTPQPDTYTNPVPFPRNRVRPVMIGNDVVFLPRRNPDEPTLMERFYNWLFG